MWYYLLIYHLCPVNMIARIKNKKAPTIYKNTKILPRNEFCLFPFPYFLTIASLLEDEKNHICQTPKAITNGNICHFFKGWIRSIIPILPMVSIIIKVPKIYKK